MASTNKKIILTDAIYSEVQQRAEALPVFENSHRKYQANVVGCFGEVLFEMLLHHHKIDFIDNRDTTTHDYTVGNGITIDVKTKDRTVAPQRHYENSVPLYNHEHQRPDFYYFVSLQRDKGRRESDIRRFTHGYMLGGIDLGTLEGSGKQWEAGEIDPANGTKFWTACINIGMSGLMSNEEFFHLIRKY